MEISRPRAPFIETSSRSGLAIAASAARCARFSPDASPVPIMALPMPRMTERTSAKSRLINPSFTMRSVMQATPEYRTWSAIANASAKVVFSFATRNRFWFGITMRVSTASCSSLTPASATRARRTPSNWNGFVTTPTVRIPMSRAVRAITGAAPVPVPPPMPAVMKAMWAPESWSRISSITSSAAARPTSGCEPAPRPCVTPTPIWMIRAAFDEDSAWASVFATTNSQPRRPASIMLLTALPPAPPIPNTVMRGLSSRMSGACRLMVMIFSLSSRLSPTSARPARLFQPWRRRPDRARTQPVSKALANPLPDLAHVAVRPGALAKAARARLEVLGMRDLRIDEEPDRGREGRPFGGLRHALDAERPADPDLPLQNLLGEIGKPDELAATSGQYDPAAGLRGEARVLEALADELEDLLEARLDDAHELRLRQVVRNVALVLVNLVDGDHVAVVRARRDAGAVERLEALGGGDPGREPARDVHRDMVTADRDGVGVDEVAAGEDADARRAAAHVDDGDPHLGLVVDERRKAGGVRCRDHRLDAEMAALDGEHEVARRRSLGADDVEIDGKALADHAARLDDVGLGVEGIAGRQRMQDGAAGTQRVAARRGKDALHVGRSDRMADADRALEMLRAEPSAGQVDDHRLDLDLRHPLRGVDGLADRAFGGLEIDARAACRGSPSAGAGRRGRRSCSCRCRARKGSRSCATTAASCVASGRCAGGSRLDPLAAHRLLLEAFEARRGGLLGEPHDDAVRHAQVDRDHVLLQDALLALELDEAQERVLRAMLGKADVQAVVHLERPPAPGDERPGADAAFQRPRRLDQGEVVPGVEVRLLADDERQIGEARLVEGVDDGAVGRDDEELAVLLPQRVGVALDEGDDELVGVELAHGGALDEGQRLEPLAGLAHAQERQRHARRDAGGVQDLDLGQGRDADDRDLLDAEAERAGEDMMGLAVGLTQRLDMPAEHEAGAAGEPEEAEDEPGAEEARQAALERDGDRAPAPEPRPGEEAEEADRGQLGARARRNGRAAGGAGAQRSYEASSTIHLTNSPNEKHAWAAISATKLVSVMPGCVLTSSTTSSPVPPTLGPVGKYSV